MMGIFGRLGRARDLQHFDDALRAAGLHPALASEAVKMTVIRLLKAAHGEASSHIPDAGVLVAYCMLGPGPYAEINGADLTQTVERRIHEAVAQEDSLDAEIVMLTIHAGVIHPEVVERFGLGVDG